MAITANFILVIAAMTIVLNGAPVFSAEKNDVPIELLNCSYLITAKTNYTYAGAVAMCERNMNFLPSLAIASNNTGHLDIFADLLDAGHRNGAINFWTGLRYDLDANKTYLGDLEVSSPKIEWVFNQNVSIDCLIAKSEGRNEIQLSEGDCDGEYHVVCVGVNELIAKDCSFGERQIPSYDMSCNFSCEDSTTTVSPSQPTQSQTTGSTTADGITTSPSGAMPTTESPPTTTVPPIIGETTTTCNKPPCLSSAQITGIVVGCVVLFVVCLVGGFALRKPIIHRCRSSPIAEPIPIVKTDEPSNHEPPNFGPSISSPSRINIRLPGHDGDH